MMWRGLARCVSGCRTIHLGVPALTALFGAELAPTLPSSSPVAFLTHTPVLHDVDLNFAPRRRLSFAANADDDTDTSDQETQHQLLELALTHVKSQGWSQRALQTAAVELSLSPSFARSLPRGEASLVEHFITKCNKDLATFLKNQAPEWQTRSTNEKLYIAFRHRLELLAPYINTWPEALSILSQPQHVPHALKLLHELIDDVCYAANDTSTDVRWYTKRLLLGAVYTSVELYMLTDFSPGFQDTWEALDRRLKDCTTLDQFM